MNATPPRDWGAVKAVFFEALELPRDARNAFLARECAGDAELRAEVQSLLASHDDERPFLDVPPVPGAARALSTALDEHDIPSTHLQPGTRIGQYEVLDSIGSGGMGDVYRARDTRLRRFVALKIVADQTSGTADRVLHEARAASALNHPNICTLYEEGEVDGQPYLAMEYIAGRPLNSLIPPDGFDAASIVTYGAQIADALAHAHEHGVIHRDLKSANVVVTPEGRAKVLDFGIARRADGVGEREDSGPVAPAGTTSGTLAYMAPELLRDHHADARSDIWALGVVLYEMAAGRPPFVGDTAFDVASAILNETPPLLPATVPADLRTLILRCLERSPDARFQRASDVASRLETFAATRRASEGSHHRLRRAVLGRWVAAALLVSVYPAYQWGGEAPRNAGASATSVAVLPFDVPSDAPEIGFLGIGIPDAIISRVSLVKSVRVKAALIPGKENEDPTAAGRDLGVGYVLTGTIQKDGRQIRVTPNLVRVGDGVAIWTRPYVLAPTDLLRLQDEIARAVLEALPVQMSGEDHARVSNRGYTENPAAHELYLHGRAELSRNAQTNTEAAFASFQEALALDNAYVLAHAGVAVASARMRHFFAKEEEVRTWESRAHTSARRAIALAPDLAESHEALAAVFRSTEFKWAETVSESAAALARNPGLDQPHLFLASAFEHLGLLDRANVEAQAAMDINQTNVDEPLRIRGVAAMHGGRYDAAVSLLERAAALSKTPAEWNLAYAFYNAGRKSEAESMLRQKAMQSGSARSQRRAQATLASFLAARGEAEEARKLIDAVIGGSYSDHHVAYALGVAYAQLDMPREALHWLGEARNTGFSCYPWFDRDPLLGRFRQNAEFRSFLAEFRQSWETVKAQYAGGNSHAP